MLKLAPKMRPIRKRWRRRRRERKKGRRRRGGEEGGEEGEGGCESDGGEEIPRVVKFGPPTRRGNSPTQLLSETAGPSRLPPANRSQKGRKAKATKAVEAGKKKGGKTEKSRVTVESDEFDDVGVPKVSKSINAQKALLLTHPRLKNLQNANA